MNWEKHQPTLDESVDRMGIELSLAIHCAVHFPAYNKRVFECEHGVIFPVYMNQYDKAAWVKKHEEEKEMASKFQLVSV